MKPARIRSFDARGLWLAPLLFMLALIAASFATARNSQSAAPADSQKNQSDATASSPRRIKLMLKDGSYELVREYHVEGDRVRYYNLDSSQWDQMPAALVDWDATKKAEATEASRESSLLAKVHKQEEERTAGTLDIDASLEAAPGVFLPSGIGLWAFDGHNVLPIGQAEIESKLSKTRVLEQVMVPVPIIPTRHDISIKGEHAATRIRTGQPEFYIRMADSRTPDLRLIRAKIHGDGRQIEHVDELFNEQWQSANTVPMQRWEVAKGVFRFTLGETLPAGEYVLAEMLQNEEASLYVWDFGVDANGGAKAQ